MKAFTALAFSFLILALPVTAQQIPQVKDSILYAVSWPTIEGKRCMGFLNASGFCLLDAKNDTVLFKAGD